MISNLQLEELRYSLYTCTQLRTLIIKGFLAKVMQSFFEGAYQCTMPFIRRVCLRKFTLSFALENPRRLKPQLAFRLRLRRREYSVVLGKDK